MVHQDDRVRFYVASKLDELASVLRFVFNTAVLAFAGFWLFGVLALGYYFLLDAFGFWGWGLACVHFVHAPDVVEEIGGPEPGVCFGDEVAGVQEVARA